MYISTLLTHLWVSVIAFMRDGPLWPLIFFYCFIVTMVGVPASYLIRRREGYDFAWGPSRFFAKLKRVLEKKIKKKQNAYLWTEIVSGLFHAPAGYLLGYVLGLICGMDTEATTPALWMCAIVFIFWSAVGLGRFGLIENQLKRDAKNSTRDLAVKLFLNDPLRWLVDRNGAPPWREDNCCDITVKSMGVTIAFVEGIVVDAKERRATIRHIAVVEGFERLGIGRRLALTLRAELVWRHKIDRIEFAESSTKYEIACYPEFFRSLGAVQRDTFQTRPGRGNWVWKT
ncbi:hypothetical protein NC77_15885 [Janthinobacterium lividum]|uniref:GNAT family N-acetyltransferase n=1 Tax=Janthinobacterium lividum TaxID=29581 RepID=UPI0005379E00|nr:GNAT family N-acetyltransferase [Janthinobacterium lividum]KHA77845.1 hypothetical protein NC77_15885 [Janthinobacterium lividum]